MKSRRMRRMRPQFCPPLTPLRLVFEFASFCCIVHALGRPGPATWILLCAECTDNGGLSVVGFAKVGSSQSPTRCRPDHPPPAIILMNRRLPRKEEEDGNAPADPEHSKSGGVVSRRASPLLPSPPPSRPRPSPAHKPGGGRRPRGHPEFYQALISILI